MEKHLYIYYGDALGLGETDLTKPTIAAGKSVASLFVEACTESFTTENGTYHYQPEYRKEAFAYLEKQGVKVPITS
jgi:hypothetical protein